MEPASRSWQFSLSNWSVTRKVGVVLVLPVMLATTFAVLRINAELETMTQLGAATEQAAVIRPVVKFATATEQLAVAATANWGAIADPQTDAALTTYDQALAEVQSALRMASIDRAVADELTAATTTGATLRNTVRSGSPAMVGEQTDEIGERIGNALAKTPVVEDYVVQRYFLQLTALHQARRVLTRERTLVVSPDAGTSQSARSRMLVELGSEQTMIKTYAMILPGNAGSMASLLDAVQTRISVFSQNNGDPTTNAAVLNTLQVSADTYAATISALLDEIDKTLDLNTSTAQTAALREATLVLGMLLSGLALALAVARTLVVPVRRLRRDALEVAHVKLPDELAVVRSGGATPEIAPVGVHSTDEIGQLARAVDEMHEQALNLAADQARLRLQIGNMFETLSRRSQSLVEQQLALIEELEHDEDNPSRLQTLFRLDHLATRMRRNGDNLLVLAGTALRRGHLPPVPLSDMLWSAVSQVEDYQRVEIGNVPDGVVAGESAVDIEHLLAELIDNALRYSPPSTSVAVIVGRAVDGGYLIEITDRGLGMSADDLRTTNERLASGGEVTIETARRMGLFVVGRLAKRHTITVSLRRTNGSAPQPGITASVHLPSALVAPPPPSSGPATGPNPLVSTGPNPLVPAGLTAADVTGPNPIVGLGTPNPLIPAANPLVPPQYGATTGAYDASDYRAPLTKAGLPQRVSTTPEPEPVEEVPSGLWAEHPVEELPEPKAETTGLPQRTPSATWQVPPPVRPSTDQSTAAWPLPTRDRSDASGRSAPARLQPLDGFGADTSAPHPLDPRPDSPADETAAARPHLLGDETADTARRPDSEPLDDRRYKPTDLNRPDGGEDDDTTSSAQPLEPVASAPEQAAPAPAEDTTQDPVPTSSTRLQPVNGEAPTPIYQRMVSEWLVEPSTAASESTPNGASWSSPGDAGWSAAASADSPPTSARTSGGLPIRKPGAQLVPGGLAPAEEAGARDPEEIRNNLTRHLSGVRSGRAEIQYNDGGLE
ncbi:sensor histidine kinase [Nocardia caishijiensis]|uniref:histidine kinase n=1 Tax=Nocardia caishijiensis TaxID=184756 RepID=A0ABQ6YSY8_9NOCA|nr:ATP-binding protein [Nocardia caishijiensis]KAF0848748.1 signal transduction histidine kinase [Nocardia caishijiensis]